METGASVDKQAINLLSHSDVKTEKFYNPFFSIRSERPVFGIASQVQCVDTLTDISSLCRITISLECRGLFSAGDTSFLLIQ